MSNRINSRHIAFSSILCSLVATNSFATVPAADGPHFLENQTHWTLQIKKMKDNLGEMQKYYQTAHGAIARFSNMAGRVEEFTLLPKELQNGDQALANLTKAIKERSFEIKDGKIGLAADSEFTKLLTGKQDYIATSSATLSKSYGRSSSTFDDLQKFLDAAASLTDSKEKNSLSLANLTSTTTASNNTASLISNSIADEAYQEIQLQRENEAMLKTLVGEMPDGY